MANNESDYAVPEGYREEPTSATDFPPSIPSIPSIIEQKIVYIDMDNVLVDFKHALRERGIDPDMNDAD